MRIWKLIRGSRIGVFVFGRGVKIIVWSMGMGFVDATGRSKKPTSYTQYRSSVAFMSCMLQTLYFLLSMISS